MNPFDQFDESPASGKESANPFDQFDSTGAKSKKNSVARGIADLGLGFAGGAVGATKAIADAAGAGNVVSETLDTANKGITGYLSDSAKADQQTQSAIMKEAEGGSAWDGIKAGAKAFSVAPAQTMVSGLGSIVPVLAGTAATALTGGGAPAALAAGAGVGATMGAGAVKGAIHEEIKKRGIESGMSEADATAAATKAQEYGGENTGNIATGAVLGMADAATGVTAAAGKMVRNAIIKPVATEATTAATRGLAARTALGMAGEMPLEAAQGGQEKYAANVAAQRAGYEVGTWDGVASQATLEALASAGPGALFGAMSGSKYVESKRAETPPAEENPGIAGLLPSPTYTGTPTDQMLQAETERQAAIDAADTNAAAVYAARDAFEKQLRQSVTIINEPAPLQQRIDEMLNIDAGQMTKAERVDYDKALVAAFSEPIGIRHDENQKEVPFTMGEYLDAQAAAEDAVRSRPARQNAAQQADARLNQLATEEETQQTDISQAARRTASGPAIPVIGALSAVANMAVQSGAHATAVAQQAAATQAKAKPASAPEAGPLSEVANAAAPNISAQAPSISPAAPSIEANTNGQWSGQVAQEAPQANAPQAGPASSKGSPAEEFIKTRTDGQLTWLSEKGTGENKALAKAELQRRQSAAEIPNGDGVTSAPTDSIAATPKIDNMASAIERVAELSGQSIDAVRGMVDSITMSHGVSAASRALAKSLVKLEAEHAKAQSNQNQIKNTSPSAATGSNSETAQDQGAIKNQSEQPLDMVATVDAGKQPKTNTAAQASPANASATPSRAKPLEKWTLEELIDRKSRGGLSEESAARIDQAIAPLQRAKDEKEARAAKFKAARNAFAEKRNAFSIGPSIKDAEPVSVVNGVVHIGGLPAVDYDTEADITVPEGASKLQIVSALRKGGAISSGSKVFGANDKAEDSPAEPEQSAVATAPKTQLKPMADPRIDKYADDLRAMSKDAGWAEEGGKLLIDADGKKTRTKWLPSAEWFLAGMINSPVEVLAAVNKAANSEPMSANEKRTISGMMDYLDRVNEGVEHGNADADVLADAGYDEQSKQFQDVVNLLGDFDFDTQGAAQDESAAMRSLGFTEDDINELTQGKPGNSEGSNEDAAGATGKGSEKSLSDRNEAGQGQQQEGEELTLARQTNTQAAAEFKRQQEEAAKKDEAPASPTVKADQVDLFNTQESLFNSNRDAAPEIEAANPEESKPDESDRVPRQYNTMADIDSAIEAIYDGTVSLEDYKAAFNGLMANKDAIVGEFGKMTIPQLHERFGKQPYGRPEKKGEIIERAFEAVRNTFSLRRNYGRNSYSMGRGEYEKYLADNLAALTELVNSSTVEDLKKFADEIGQDRAARQEKIEAAQDPKTIEDFNNALRLKKLEGISFAEARMSLTADQRAEYDRLKGIESRDQRKARADQQKTDVRVASQTTDGQIVETKHAKTGEPLFVVKSAERVDRDVYNQWNTTAKRMGGYYSSFRGNGAVPGFQFKTRDNADAFLAFIGGNADAAKEVVQERRDSFADDRSQSAVERLNEMAGRLEERADESLGRERKANTERRARFAASAESAANAEKAMAKTMRRIAGAISDGTTKFLDRVRQKAQIEYLAATLRTAKDSEARAESPNDWYTKELHKKPATSATADYAEFPQYAMMRSDLANLARKMISLPNMKMLGQRILKVADDTSDAYNAFAKEHLLEVSKFGKADGSGWATFSTLKDAERSIEVSNLMAVAVPLQIKRGEYRLVLSPSEAINRGIWKGDDRKMYLSQDIGSEIVEKMGRLNRKHGQRRGMDAPPAAPWQFENAYNNLKRLAGMGIEQPWEFRAALLEFADLKEAPKEADKIKAMERAMIGRKNDGLDFFPTPAETAQAMIDAAEITEGMSVLEPSAGMGHIAEQIRDAGVSPDVIEFNGDRRELLEAKGFNVVGTDFMEASDNYDRIIMNPPFSNRRDAEHVQHAYTLLKPGGRLVAIMGEGVFFGQDKKAVVFREWLDELGGTSEKLESGTFLDPSLPVNTATNARMVVIEKPEGMTAPADNEGVGNIASPSTISPADKAIYGMAAEGKSAAEILRFVATASRNPFNRQLAKLLLKTGIAPSVTVGDAKGWKFNAGEGNKYAAAYNPNTDTVALFRPAAAERNMMHELVHAATLKALSGKGMAAAQMSALYKHVKKTGKLKGMYGMSDIDEFIAEAFTNPKFQEALKKVAAPQMGSKLPSAWHWFVRIVKGILGLPDSQTDALSQALEIGVGVMREDKAIRKTEDAPGRDVPFSTITGTEIDRVLGRTTQEKATNWMRVNLQGKSFKNDATGWDISVGRKGINKTMMHGGKETHARSVAAIPSLLKNAVRVATEQNRDEKERVSVPLVHHFYAPLRMNGADYVARMVIKEATDGHRFYDFDTSDEISPAVPGETLPFSQRMGAAPSARLNMSMAELLSYVKKEHGGTDPRFIRYNVADEGSDLGKIVGDSGRNYDQSQRQFFKNVGRDTETKGRIEKTLDYLKNNFWKKMAIGIVDQFRGLRDLKDGGQAYLLARLSKGTAGAFETLLHHGKLSIKDGVYDGDQSGGFVERLGVALHGELDDFMWYVAANRAEGLAKHERENLFTPADIAAGKSLANGTTEFDYTIQTGPAKGRVTRVRSIIYADANRVFNEFQKNTLDIAEQSGLIDGATRKFWESEFYVPFYRVSEEDGEFVGGKMGNALVRQQAFKKLKGGTDKLNSDLLSNTLLNWSHLIEASAKNRAAKASLVAAEQVGAAHLAEPGEKNTVWFMENGQKVEYGVDDEFVMTAITSLEYAGMRNGIMDVMTKFKHYLTIGVTASPAFKVRNLIRDSIQAIGTSDLGYNPVKNVVEGFKQSSRDSQEYVSALASGGLIRFGTMLEGSESARVRQLIKSGVKDSTILNSENKVRAFYDKFIDPAVSAYNELGNRSEEITRSALYNQMIKNGSSHADAALAARDLMDFSMQGSFNTIRFLTQVVPFMNARLQGMYKLGRSAKDNPKKLAVVTGAVALASIALMLANGDDDDWKRREDWDRDNFWWFKFGGIEYRIPKPFEVGAVGTLAERSVEYMISDEMTGERFRKVVSDLVMHNLSMNPVPQAVKPIVDLYANKDSFTGRPIESMSMQRLDTEMRYNSNTSLVARGLSTVTGGLASPVQYDHLARAYFGWLGSFVIGGADMLTRPMTNEPERPERDYWKFATQGILKEHGSGNSRYLTMVYDQAKELEQAHATHRQMIKEGKLDDARYYAEDNAEKLKRYRMVEQVKRAESKFNENIRSVERGDLEPEEKKIRIERIQQMKENVAKRIAPGLQ